MTDPRFPGCRIHPTALLEEGVSLGEDTSVWDNVHIRKNARIGRSCILGEKTYVAYDVVIGNFCKLNANVYVCAGVTIGDDVMISAHVVFTNDRFPRSFHISPGALAGSDPTDETLPTLVRQGVTLGAASVIGPGLTLNEFSMVGMGSVVTRTVPPYGLVVGNPARLTGFVCACGPLLVRSKDWDRHAPDTEYACARCGRTYLKHSEGIREASGPAHE